MCDGFYTLVASSRESRVELCMILYIQAFRYFEEKYKDIILHHTMLFSLLPLPSRPLTFNSFLFNGIPNFSSQPAHESKN